MQILSNLWRSDAAQDTSEYALLLLLITAALITAIGTLSGAVQDVITTIAGKLKVN